MMGIIEKEGYFNSVRWICTIGINSGYELTEQKELPIVKMSEIYKETAAELFQETGVYISAVITPSRTLYHQEWGCPEGGEYSYTLSGSCNPAFNNKEEYLRVLSILAERLRNKMAQTTLLMEVMPVHLDYYRKEE